MKPTRNIHRAIPAALALLASSSLSHAAGVIFNDTFDSGTGSWYRAANTGSLANVDSKLSWSEGIGNSSNMGEAIGRSFTAQTLAVGETIRLTFDFSWTAADNTNIFRVGFFDTTNAIAADNWSGSGAIGAWKGYYTMVRDNSATGNHARESTHSSASGTDGPTSSTVTNSEKAITSPLNTTSFNILNGTTYQGMFEVTRTTASSTTTLFTLKTGATTHFSVTGIDSTTPYSTFDSVVIKTGAAGPVTLLDNVKLETIPEPSAAALGAFGLLALLRRRRI